MARITLLVLFFLLLLLAGTIPWASADVSSVPSLPSLPSGDDRSGAGGVASPRGPEQASSAASSAQSYTGTAEATASTQGVRANENRIPTDRIGNRIGAQIDSGRSGEKQGRISSQGRGKTKPAIIPDITPSSSSTESWTALKPIPKDQ